MNMTAELFVHSILPMIYKETCEMMEANGFAARSMAGVSVNLQVISMITELLLQLLDEYKKSPDLVSKALPVDNN